MAYREHVTNKGKKGNPLRTAYVTPGTKSLTCSANLYLQVRQRSLKWDRQADRQTGRPYADYYIPLCVDIIK